MFLFIFFSLYVFLAILVRSLLMWSKTKINPFTYKNKDDAHGFNGKVFGFIFIIEFMVISCYAFFNTIYNYLLPFWYLENTVLKTVGWILICVSLLIVWIAQIQMATSWRIGIDETHTTDLVTKGLFSASRNPIFLGLIIGNIGLFLIIPNAFTFLILFLSIVSINTQVRLEEVFLRTTYKSQYITYTNKVRRWI